MRERDCASKIAALTPPPWRQRMRGSGLESGTEAGSLEGGGVTDIGIFGNAFVDLRVRGSLRERREEDGVEGR